MNILRKTLKQMFNSIGIDIRSVAKKGESRRSTLKEVLEHVYNLGFRPKTVIDVGVATGTYELYTTFPHAKHLLIEPLREFEDDLKRIANKYDAEYVLAAAGPRQGTMKIHVHKDLLGSSLYKETDGSYVDGVSRNIPVVTVDSICRKRKIKGPYLIKVDVQGGERLVLDGSPDVLKKTDVVILEIHLFQFFIDGPQFYDMVVYMKKNGFVVYDIFGGYNRPHDHALASVDMVFVKEKGQFRTSHSFASRTQRGYLNEVVLRNAKLHKELAQ